MTVRDADNPYAEIEGSFEGQNVLFVLPEAFFRNNLRGLNVEPVSYTHLNSSKNLNENKRI